MTEAVRGELSSLVRLAAPVASVQLGLMLMGVVDSMVVGHYSPDALSAVAIGNVYSWGVLVFGVGVLLCLDPIVSQAVGAGDGVGVRVAFARGMALAATLSLVLAVTFQYAAPVLTRLHQRPEIVPTAAAWVRATAPSIPAFLAFVVVRQTLQAMNVVRPVLIAAVVGNAVNLALDLVLVYGRLGAPRLGAVGSGVATTVSRWVMLGVLLVAAWPRLVGSERAQRGSWPRVLAPRELLAMVRVGVPIGLQMALESWVFLTVSLIVGVLGTDVLAAHQIALNLATVSFMVPLGIGAAAAVRVGNAIGRRDDEGARRAALVSLSLGASVMVVSALAFAVAPTLLARAYTDDAAVLRIADGLLPIAALFQIFDGTQAVGCGVLRGAGDTRAAAVINFVGYWILGLPLGLVLAFPLGLGPRGLWWGLTAALALVAALLVVRVRRRFPLATAPLPLPAAR